MQQCQLLPAADVPLPHITMYLRKSQLPRASNCCGNRNLASTYAWGNHNLATWTGAVARADKLRLVKQGRHLTEV